MPLISVFTTSTCFDDSPASLLRLIIKYNGRFEVKALMILYGISVSIDAMASLDGR